MARFMSDTSTFRKAMRPINPFDFARVTIDKSKSRLDADTAEKLAFDAETLKCREEVGEPMQGAREYIDKIRELLKDHHLKR